MEENLYQVVFTGQFTEGLSRKEILSSLAALLRKEPAEIRSLFHSADAVIVKRTSLTLAQKYVTSLNQTGALCAVRKREPSEQPPPGSPAPQAQAATGIAPAESPTATPEPAGPPPTLAAAAPAPEAIEAPTAPSPKRPQPWTLSPLPGPPDITLSPQICANAGAIPGGLTTNRKDWATLPFADLKLLAAFKATENPDEIKLLLFPCSGRRPLLLEGNTIAFAQFPGVTDGKLLATFRKFVILIYRSHPGIALDQATAEFMRGAPPPVFLKDPVMLISDLHRAYAAASAKER